MALSNYVNFEGRAGRGEYWWFALAFGILNLFLLLITAIGPNLGILMLFISIAMVLPTQAVSARRLHDINKSGWILIIQLIPLVGVITLLVLFTVAGTVGPNKYGSQPPALASSF